MTSDRPAALGKINRLYQRPVIVSEIEKVGV